MRVGPPFGAVGWRTATIVVHTVEGVAAVMEGRLPAGLLIPRWLSLWGLAGTVLCLTAGLLVLFQSIAVLSSTQVLLSLPLGVQEMVLAVWLIVKGFSPKTEAKPPTPTVAELHPA